MQEPGKRELVERFASLSRGLASWGSEGSVHPRLLGASGDLHVRA